MASPDATLVGEPHRFHLGKRLSDRSRDSLARARGAARRDRSDDRASAAAPHGPPGVGEWIALTAGPLSRLARRRYPVAVLWGPLCRDRRPDSKFAIDSYSREVTTIVGQATLADDMP